MPRCQMSAAFSTSRVTIGPSAISFLPAARGVECGDRVEILFREHLGIGRRGFLFEIGATSSHGDRLFVDRIFDEFLQVRVLLDQLFLQRKSRLRQDVIEVSPSR